MRWMRSVFLSKTPMRRPMLNRHCLESPACRRQRWLAAQPGGCAVCHRNRCAGRPAFAGGAGFFAGCRSLPGGTLVDQDWVQLTQSQFAPVEITADFWIVPTWHEPPAQAQRIIRLDPGLAFGTGTHPTTRMCLRWIARHGQRALGRVLDYGCGSGILAIGAAKFGAADIDAVDIDPGRCGVCCAQCPGQWGADAHRPAGQGARPVPDCAGQYPGDPLRVLAPLLCSHVASGGHLVLAGILEPGAKELQEAYAPWLPLSVADSEDGWILI